MKLRGNIHCLKVFQKHTKCHRLIQHQGVPPLTEQKKQLPILTQVTVIRGRSLKGL